jgi:tyrosyl-tRNA synthetase
MREFIAQFSQGGLPDNIPETTLAAPPEGLPLSRVLKEVGLVPSTSEAVRQVQQRAVRVDQERVEDRSLMLKAGATYLLQLGPRRFARVTLVPAA